MNVKQSRFFYPFFTDLKTLPESQLATGELETETPITENKMKEMLILGRKNGVGLDRDADLLSAALGPEVSVSMPEVGGFRGLFSTTARAEAAFHLERISPFWKRRAKRHFLIPNQERFPRRQLRRLRLVDHILCKSRHAAEIFSHFHPSVHYIGFTSVDRLLTNCDPDYNRFFHLAGKSTLKNTELLLELWQKHPEWPVLTLVQHPSNAPKTVPPNVELISRYLPDDELRKLQNTCGIHLCPSLSEGWGHYIVEAMSCRAVTLTTDAPPMNELISAERGVLIPWIRKEPRHLGKNFFVDPGKLEDAIEQLISLPVDEKKALGDAGRRWFEQNDRQFQQKLKEILYCENHET